MRVGFMTITLSWWAFPVLVFVIAIGFFLWGGSRGRRYGYAFGTGQVVVSLILFSVALSFSAGRASAGFV